MLQRLTELKELQAEKKPISRPTNLEILETTDKLHEILRIAIDDLRLTEKQPEYIIQMQTWGEPQSNGQCVVCMAGACMTHSGGIKLYLGHDGIFKQAGPRLARVMGAINNLRCGNVVMALAEFHGLIPVLGLTDKQQNIALERYHQQYRQHNRSVDLYYSGENSPFYADMEQLHKDLVTANL